MKDGITFELLTKLNIELVRRIQRDDISEAFVDTADTIMELTQYGIDHNCSGIGGYVLEKVIKMIYDEYGVRPIALGVHKDNIGAERFYSNHGFRKTAVMEGNDYYYLRYPNEKR